MERRIELDTEKSLHLSSQISGQSTGATPNFQNPVSRRQVQAVNNSACNTGISEKRLSETPVGDDSRVGMCFLPSGFLLHPKINSYTLPVCFRRSLDG
jgi:hypothetical protein